MKRPYRVKDIAAFNEHSAQLQRAAGVDPALCMKIVEVKSRSGRRISIEPFLAGITIREWVTGRRGEVRAHDESLHFGVIRQLHPDLLAMLSYNANLGVVALETDGLEGRAKAIRIGRNIDTLTNIFGFDEQFIFKKPDYPTRIAIDNLATPYFEHLQQTIGCSANVPAELVHELTATQASHSSAMYHAQQNQ